MSVAPITFRIAGSGVYMPAATSVGMYGAHHRADATETSSVMGARAATAALEDAGWSPDSLDLLLGSCGVMEQPIPSTSVLIQRRLGLGHSGIPAFDVQATCLSFLVALDQALCGIALGRYQRVLVVAADIASAALDPNRPKVADLFGDGAAAIAIEAGGPHRWERFHMETYGAHADLCRLEAGGTRLRPHTDLDTFLAHSRFSMEAMELFRTSRQLLPGFLDRLFGPTPYTPEDVDLLIPHQASPGAMTTLRRSFGLRPDQMVDIFPEFGNQIATSLPHALHVARTQGRLVPDTMSCLIGSASGVSFAGALVRW